MARGIINLVKKAFDPNSFRKAYARANRKLINDEYLKWLLFANAGMIDKGNIYAFDYAIQRLPSNSPIVEIGSFCGLSTNILSYLLIKYSKKNKLFSTDEWIFEGYIKGENIGQSKISFSKYRDFVKESFIRNTKFFSENNLPYTIQSTSDKFFDKWNKRITIKDVFDRETVLGGKISFCYVDGNHEFEFARRDYINVSKFLEIGGFILFDDSYDSGKFGSGPKLMKEIKADKRFEIVMTNPNYLFKKISD